MQAKKGHLLSLAYIVGLLCTALPGTALGLPLGAIALLISGLVAAAIAPRRYRSGPSARFWLLLGLVASLAVVHFEVRTPHPGPTDISWWISDADPPPTVTVQGVIQEEPRLTRSQKVNLTLKASTILSTPTDAAGTAIAPKQVSGKLYTTVPLLQGTGLYPTQLVQVTGTLYQPSSAQNPRGFDFRAYLAQESIFAGLRGQQLDVLPVEGRSPPLFSRLRQRIVRSLVEGLGSPEGPFLTAIVLGRQAVDLSFEVRDAFTQAGLAHTMAASGFQVSLLLGVVLVLTRRLSPQLQFGIGIAVLVAYLGLTGLEPSVVRAGVMGGGALLGATLERKTRPVGSLLLVAALMLLYNPLWIWNLGFQLSFLATLGLLVLAGVLTEGLDWMPSSIASLIAVPIAAYVWTVPLQLYNFGAISTYSILLNVITTPLILVISLGGMVSAAIALLWPPLGSLLAWALHPPIALLMALVNSFNQLPWHTFTTGSITPAQVLAIYGVYGWIWSQSHRKIRWWIPVLLIAGLIFIPLSYAQARLVRVTVLDIPAAPAIVVQERGTTGLIYGGTDADAEFTVLPYLRQHGIRRLSWAIALSDVGEAAADETAEGTGTSAGSRILSSVPVQTLYTDADVEAAAPDLTQPQPLAVNQELRLGPHAIRVLSLHPTLLEIRMGTQPWLILNNGPTAAIAPLDLLQNVAQPPSPPPVLWWSGSGLDAQALGSLSPSVAIAPTFQIPSGQAPLVATPAAPVLAPIPQTTYYATRRDGAVHWTPTHGFTSVRQAEETMGG